MKIIYLKIVIIVLVILPHLMMAQGVRDKKEQIEAMRVAFITKQLDLNAREAQQFWPVFNEYQDKLEAMRKARKKGNKLSQPETMTDKEAEIFVDNEIEYRVKEADLQKQYFTRFKIALPIKKAALLIKAEDDFKRELLKQIKDKN